PVEHVLDGNIEQQLNVIWKGLNDKNFTVPTNPASVEQFWLVKPEGPARILRDVFSLPESAGGGYVARSFAVGFPNGHSVLFDLDRYEVRQWTVGDFAGQRTEGKSWYWDMAGVPVLNLPEDSSRFVLRWENKTVPLDFREAQAGELVSYHPEGNGVRLHFKLRFKSDAPASEGWSVDLEEVWSPIDKMGMAGSGWRRSIHANGVPAGAELVLQVPETVAQSFDIVHRTDGEENQSTEGQSYAFRKQLEIDYLSRFSTQQLDVKENPPLISELDQLTTIPGFEAVRLPLDTKIMPTAFHWDQNGRLIFTSLEGHLFRATDSNEDGIEDSLQMIEEGLAAPYGVMPLGDGLLVAHKPELLLLKDTDGDGRADEREVFSSGWGYSDNYHDWTTGFAVDAEGNLFVGLGSDYAQPKRPADRAKWRGSVLKISTAGEAEPFSFAFRYPTGIAFDSKGRLFATDNQGVQNTFNELNHLQEGRHYGVPARYETNRDAEETPPAIQIPHPWTRTINGIAFIPEDLPALEEFAGHGLGCELNSRLLIRFTLQEVGGVVQGATYYFSEPIEQSVRNNFLGPLSIGISNEGAIYVGSIQDAGWMGGQNIGTIARLKHSGQQPNGIRELTATPNGFRIECFHPVSKPLAETIGNYQVSGYTRQWGGAYATPDSERHRGEITAVELSKDGRTIDLSVEGLREGFVYEVTCSKLVPEGETFFPETGHYTLHKIPAK
ncbi:MAG TPA: PQQ-dependent sugar dehydrogenase, partial [Planctomycetaceae bacterium]|nr:PQQ-dependent sugar dehydrogenase [Planctomycetaceae bacterium]